MKLYQKLRQACTHRLRLVGQETIRNLTTGTVHFSTVKQCELCGELIGEIKLIKGAKTDADAS